MSWQTNTTLMVRHLINDLDSSAYKYSDARLEASIAVAAQLTLLDLDFDNTYSVNLSTNEITPDPSSDTMFTNIVAMRTAMMIVGGEVKIESAKAISVRDGPSAIDLRGVSATLMGLYKDLSLKYDEMVQGYGYAGSLGHAILGPYSPGSHLIGHNTDDKFR